MNNYCPPLDEMQFLLHSVFQLEKDWQQWPAQEGLDACTSMAILNQAASLFQEVIAPLNRSADEQGCELHQGRVISPKGFKEAYQHFCAGGWCGLGGSPDWGGMGMPKALAACVDEMLQGSCMAFGLAPMLTAGACLALEHHASDALKQQYLPKMLQGVWAGAMDLTEPQAGSDLSLISTKAQPNNDDSFSLTGTKIFITWGDQDFSENIIHLVLAKLPDAPPGSKGVSLFLVPKIFTDASGNLLDKNTLTCEALEKKMGIKGAATCVMHFAQAKGWLIGQPHQGLACMFTMMNYERLVVGIQGLGVAHGSYCTAAAYVQERLQGRAPGGARYPQLPADPLVCQPDIQRQLLTMQALTMAGRAFYVYVAMQLDKQKFSLLEEERLAAVNKVALLTPVVKAFVTDKALETCLYGQQLLGGHGYMRDWGQEQAVRDVRITQIYEGTNAIQAHDLLGRKIINTQGALLQGMTDEVSTFIQQNGEVAAMQPYLAQLDARWQGLQQVTKGLVEQAPHNSCLVGANAVDYLHLLGLNLYAYLWAKMLLAALQGPEAVSGLYAPPAQFFYARLLPDALALEAKITAPA